MKPRTANHLPSIFTALISLTSLFTFSCSQKPLPSTSPAPIVYYSPWDYTDLRLIDPTGAVSPSQDLIAIYNREIGEEVQFRIDLLDHSTLPDYDLYLALDNQPGGTYTLPLSKTADLAWDVLFIIPAKGEIQAVSADWQPQHGTGLRVIRDVPIHTVTISLSRTFLSQGKTIIAPSPGFKLQVFLTPPASAVPTDWSEVLNSQGNPPKPAQVLLAFWNTYPAYTPALALRRWDGAHTGPGGGRHGLYNLLRTAQNAEIPIVLLDLKNPASLIGLDYAGHLELVKEMSAAGWLILPQTLPDGSYGPLPLDETIIEMYLRQELELLQTLGLSPSPFLYSPLTLPSSFRGNVLFSSFPQEALPNSALEIVGVARWRGHRVILLPGYGQPTQEEQATLKGFDLEVRKALVKSAIAAQNDSGSLLILGGELPASTWGDPQCARAAFHYLNTHPWIKDIDANDLLTLPISKEPPPLPLAEATTDSVEKKIFDDLKVKEGEAPSPLHQAALQAFYSLYEPIYPHDENLTTLRRGYLGQIHLLLEAAKWAEKPISTSDCTRDLDLDGEIECILSSKTVLATFEIESGTLTNLFLCIPPGNPANCHQLVAPSSQLITALSDSSTWISQNDHYLDPSVINGGFSEPSAGYQVKQIHNGLVFISNLNSTRKSFTLTESGLYVEYQPWGVVVPPPQVLPLVFDPWVRYRPNWAAQHSLSFSENSLTWGINPTLSASIDLKSSFEQPTPIQMHISCSASLVPHSFLDSQPYMTDTENPNFDYPSGHFLPFPLVLIEIHPQGGFFLQIETTQY